MFKKLIKSLFGGDKLLVPYLVHYVEGAKEKTYNLIYIDAFSGKYKQRQILVNQYDIKDFFTNKVSKIGYVLRHSDEEMKKFKFTRDEWTSQLHTARRQLSQAKDGTLEIKYSEILKLS